MSETVVTKTGPRGLMLFFVLSGSLLVPFIIGNLVVMPDWLGYTMVGTSLVLCFGVFIREGFRRSRLRWRLSESGKRGYGTVVRLQAIGRGRTRTNETVVRIVMDVKGDGKPFRVSHRAAMTAVHTPQVQPGETVAVLWDGDDRRIFVLDLEL